MDQTNAELWEEGEQFPLHPYGRYCLLKRVDRLGFVLSQAEAIPAFERERQC